MLAVGCCAASNIGRYEEEEDAEVEDDEETRFMFTHRALLRDIRAF
jgi:hypothetical protein